MFAAAFRRAKDRSLPVRSALHVREEGRDGEASGASSTDGRIRAGDGVSARARAAALLGTLRCISNLLEKFHQSFYYYLLVETHL